MQHHIDSGTIWHAAQFAQHVLVVAHMYAAFVQSYATAFQVIQAHVLRHVRATEQLHKVMQQQLNCVRIHAAMHVSVIENSLPTWLEIV